MNLFDVHTLAYVLHSLGQVEMSCTIQKASGQGAQIPDIRLTERADKAFAFAENFFQLHKNENCSTAIRTAKYQWDRPLRDYSTGCEIFHRLQIDIVGELESTKFIEVAIDRADFVDNEKLFGELAFIEFPSARRDIKEAGNCFAAECPTATVFHLMRASEIGLRALARDRNMEFKDKPLEQKEWGHIVTKLDSIVKELRETDLKKWAKPEFKEAQLRFYSELVPELRAFNEAWRRHISHADTEAFYDRDSAASIISHVKTFMQKLGSKISENKSTPMYWDAS